MKKLSLLFIIYACSLHAQDTIRFTSGNAIPVKVDEIGATEIKYNRWDNITGPIYRVNKNEVRYIRYVNGMVDTFAVVKPKEETFANETPAYVNTLPQQPAFEQIIIIKKKLFYDHHALNDKALMSVIRKHPEQGVQNLMLREYSKLSIYKNNRVMGKFLFYGGIGVSIFAINGAFGLKGGGGAFLLGTAAGISGSVISIVNKNKYFAKRAQIAKIYNGGFQQ